MVSVSVDGVGSVVDRDRRDVAVGERLRGERAGCDLHRFEAVMGVALVAVRVQRDDAAGDVEEKSGNGGGFKLQTLKVVFLHPDSLPDGEAGEMWTAEPLLSVAGYADFAREVAGLPLCCGHSES